MLNLCKADTAAVQLIHVTQVLNKYRGQDYALLLGAGDFSQDLYTLMSHLFTYPMPKHAFLVDEKFGNDRFHDKSNEKLIRESGFLGRLSWSKVLWHPILTGYDNPDTISKTYEKDVMVHLQKFYGKVVGIFGMGLDGSVSGILPGSEAVTSKGFVAWYNNEAESTIKVSITTECIHRFVTEAILILDSNEKLAKLNEIMAGKPDNVKYPVNVLRDVPTVTVISK